MKSIYRTKTAAAGLFFLAAGLLLLLPFWGSGPWHLVIEAPRSGVVYYTLPVEPGDEFTLTYRHSVSGSVVYGSFVLTAGGEIQPLTTTFSSFGPGLPWLDGEETCTVEGGLITVHHREDPRDKISLWVSPFTEEMILLNGSKYDLAALTEGPLLLKISLLAPK